METELCAVAPTDWQIRSVEDVCARVTSGGTPSRREPSYYVDGAWPWVKTQELQDKWIDDTEEHITDEAIASSSAQVLPANTVLVAMYGATVGQLGILRRPMTCNQACSALIVDPSAADHRYLYFQLLHIRSQLKALATGAAQQNLSGVLIKSLRLPFPQIPEQRAIAHILGTLDDKIELNRRMNETLEAMERALFKSWFVDFAPVRAKVEGRDPGLPHSLADFFPDSFEDSELGVIPSGWAARELKEVLTESNERIGEAEAAEYSSTNTGLQPRSERFKKELSRSSAKNKLIRNGYLVFGLSRRVLNFGLMRDTIGSVSSAYKVFAVDQGVVAPDLLERLMRLQPNYFYNAVSASSREGQSVSTEGLGLLRFAQPAPEVQDAFYRITGPLSGQINALQEQSQSLAALRDTLLPKLISGELRVEDAARFVGGGS